MRNFVTNVVLFSVLINVNFAFYSNLAKTSSYSFFYTKSLFNETITSTIKSFLWFC